MTKPRKTETTPRKPGGGRKPSTTGAKINYTTRLPPDLVEWLRSLNPGETERILQKARTNSLIV